MTPKVSKEPKAKQSPAKSSKKKGATAVNPQVRFLWTCIECSLAGKEGGGAGIDFAAVAEKLNIRKETANKRFSRLKIFMRNMDSMDEESEDEGLKDEEVKTEKKTPPETDLNDLDDLVSPPFKLEPLEN
ncbi:hypothetical protein N7533_004600 [Penicillium manginii]|uniref:uncharacterized protein n=1 Tax=Penicillium manginii TaxID=203109 RepID=UPI002549817C|nr:uncharacterized protein N7533_004600 [Penicillium manginii]KAJ5755057.1 hypothetical protein N7533_004600 [Penicillium manginii]